MAIERGVTVRVREGLHARPATQFVKLAKSFAADVELVREGQAANAKSSVKLMLLGVKEDDRILIRANGADEDEAVESLVRFIETPDAGLDVGTGNAAAPAAEAAPAVAAPPASAVPTTLVAQKGPAPTPAGIAASEGAAIGPVFAFFPEVLKPERRTLAPEAVGPELARYRAALAATLASLDGAREGAGVRAQDRAIVEALAEVARDEDLVERVEHLIRGGLDAVCAVLDAGDDLAGRFEALSDPYLRARAEDVRGVTRTLALALAGRSEASLADVPPGAIVAAEEVSAWDFAKAPIASIAGILCTKGGATSHVAIMARTHGIPAVLGYSGTVADLKAARTVALDGGTGEVVLDPSDVVAAEFTRRVERDGETRRALAAYAGIEPRTKAGLAIEVAANLGSLNEIDAAKKAGAMGVGLFRTELLFMERKGLPSEDEQAAVYTELAQAFAPRPVIVRTLDIGGDKPIAGVEFPHEENPFLGWRGVRMCLDRPDVFRPQLKALLRAATVGNIKVMVPMITHSGELLAVKALVEECRAELEAAGVATGRFDLGIMMETPAAAFMAEDLARHAAFFSIGTNDLTQYVMAADRLNPRLAALNRAEQPAVLKAVEMICAAAKTAGIWVGVCGEAAARPDLIPHFVRYGVTELSMSPSSIPRAKKCVTDL